MAVVFPYPLEVEDQLRLVRLMCDEGEHLPSLYLVTVAMGQNHGQKAAELLLTGLLSLQGCKQAI